MKAMTEFSQSGDGDNEEQEMGAVEAISMIDESQRASPIRPKKSEKEINVEKLNTPAPKNISILSDISISPPVELHAVLDSDQDSHHKQAPKG